VNIRAMILAFESVARTASACLVDHDGREIAYRDLNGGEAERGLVSLLDGLIRQYGPVDAVAVAAGPGSFTGLRIGVVAARTLAWMEQLPVHAVDSLAARAAQAGDGLWWVLLPLKRDTTFHGLFRVVGGVVETVQATVASADADTVALHPLTMQAVAIGPALSTKPELAPRWCAGITLGDASPLTARGVARLARQVPAQSWENILPIYHQASAPELQRAREALSAASLPTASRAMP
jgi:tRNA threonylcarbamoyladenosine biosynthesis protein TsaB